MTDRDVFLQGFVDARRELDKIKQAMYVRVTTAHGDMTLYDPECEYPITKHYVIPRAVRHALIADRTATGVVLSCIHCWKKSKERIKQFENDWDGYLIFADWLEDHDEGLLAESIRLSHAAATASTNDTVCRRLKEVQGLLNPFADNVHIGWLYGLMSHVMLPSTCNNSIYDLVDVWRTHPIDIISFDGQLGDIISATMVAPDKVPWLRVIYLPGRTATIRTSAEHAFHNAIARHYGRLPGSNEPRVVVRSHLTVSMIRDMLVNVLNDNTIFQEPNSNDEFPSDDLP